ncbi:immunoglobulin superfamily member 1-like [Macrotis lagotis]|uniref:immunoglobulin superfamily member 1-like n=1 Tax=Macrotis lagotis TaxID=92651 RepID=UPI003D68A1CB
MRFITGDADLLQERKRRGTAKEIRQKDQPERISLAFSAMSHPSLLGSLPKPHLQALSAPVVAPWDDVTLQCSLPQDSYPQPVTFILHKAQYPKPVQIKTREWTKVDFTLYSLRPNDTGNYSCIYKKTTGSYRVSEPSETLELWVIETLPKPFISATPSQLVVSGGNVTLLCWGPIRSVRFALHKEGEERCVEIRESTQGGAEFHLTHVNMNDTGQYSCHYDLGPVSSVTTPSSDLLELSEQSEKDLSSQHTGMTKGKKQQLQSLGKGGNKSRPPWSKPSIHPQWMGRCC